MGGKFVRLVTAVSSISVVVGALAGGLEPAAAAAGQRDNYIVVSENDSTDPATLRAHGFQVVGGQKEAGVLIVQTANPGALTRESGVSSVSKDRMRIRAPKPDIQYADGRDLPPPPAGGCASTTTTCPLQWDLGRIHVSDAWQNTAGSPGVKVAVLDTGLTSTHEEVGSNYDRAGSKSFVQPNTVCPADAATFASTEDFQGHGTWTNTHVAGRNGALMTGIAPNASLINVRVLGACGFGFDSWVMQGMLYGGQIGARVESMSLGGFLCAGGVVPGSAYCGDKASVGEDPQTYRAYVKLVAWLAQHGTLVVAAAGNEGVNLDYGGRVTDHATLALNSPSKDPLNDLYGTFEVPGGVPGVFAVSAINRYTRPAAPGETTFGQYGAGLRDQLTYYSNSGPAVSISAPGGARNYNVARFDCKTSECGRLGALAMGTDGFYDNPGDFGAWGVDGSGAPCSNCYAFVQGTSMATPQVAGVAALALSLDPSMSTAALRWALLRSTTPLTNRNATPVIEDDSAQPTWNYDRDYDGPAVPGRAMGTGVIDAARAVGQNNDRTA